MKRLTKKLARSLWQASAPVRRPFSRKFDDHMVRLFCSLPLRAEASSVRADILPDLDLTLNSLVRELARLQMQVETLQQQIEDLTSSERDGLRTESKLSVISETG